MGTHLSHLFMAVAPTGSMNVTMITVWMRRAIADVFGEMDVRVAAVPMVITTIIGTNDIVIGKLAVAAEQTIAADGEDVAVQTGGITHQITGVV